MSGMDAQAAVRRGHPVWAEIDLGAVRHNVEELRRLAGGAQVMGVVKGYAYGHGNPACAFAMLQAGATRLGVARVAEAVHLRRAGIAAPIHVFTEPPPEAIPLLLESSITPTVYTEAFARRLSEHAVESGRTVPLHLKLDTGMHRVGVSPDAALDAFRSIRSMPGVEIEGAWSHLAVADVPGHPFTRKQIGLFTDLTSKLERDGAHIALKHIANSAATIATSESHFDLVRCGVACFGLWPGRALEGSADLRPAMALRARVNMAKDLPKGEALSYGLRYRLERAGRVVTIPAGYADGYDRRLSGRADVLVEGRRYRVSGTVCMDQFMVDVGRTDIEVGAIATLIGSDGDERISAEELAEHVETINYEVATRIASRVPRIYLNEDPEPTDPPGSEE